MMKYYLWIVVSAILFTGCGGHRPAFESAPSPAPDCLPDHFQRTNYYTGKVLSVDDFISDQQYFNQKRRLQNRHLYGYGVVCGLLVVPEDQRGMRIKITPGIALDAQGREILLAGPAYMDLREDQGDVYIIIAYDEVKVGAVPKVGTQNPGTAYVKIRENSKIDVIHQLPGGYLSTADLLQTANRKEILSWIAGTHQRCCDGDMPVVLAKIKRNRHRITAENIDNVSYRKYVLSVDDLLPFLYLK